MEIMSLSPQEWLNFFCGVLIIGTIVFLFNIKNVVKNITYRKTDYFRITHISYSKIRTDKGKLGEYNLYKHLEPLQGYKRFIFNCYLPKEDNTTTEVDIILLHESGSYVFESKNYSGWIFGRDIDRWWTSSLPDNKGDSYKFRFFNPIIQNKIHLKCLKSYLDECIDIPFYSYVVFGDYCELKDISLFHSDSYVLNCSAVLGVMYDNMDNSQHLSQEQIDMFFDKLYPLSQVGEIVKDAHIHIVKNKQ